MASEFMPLGSGQFWGDQGKPLSYAHNIIASDGSIACIVRFDEMNNQIRKNLFKELQLAVQKKVHDQGWITRQLRVALQRSYLQAANYNLSEDASKVLQAIRKKQQDLPKLSRAVLELFVSEINVAHLQQQFKLHPSSVKKLKKKALLDRQPEVRDFSLTNKKNLFVSKDERCLFTFKEDFKLKKRAKSLPQRTSHARGK